MQEPSLVVEGMYNSEELMGLYGQMSLNVTVRFHALVFSIANAVPAVAISYDPKIDSLLESVDMPSTLNYEELNSDTIFNEILAQWNKLDQSTRHLETKSRELKAIAQNGMNQITKWIFGANEKISV
jgi:polysaccharide pyruvyl transferase WcaK-like protein